MIVSTSLMVINPEIPIFSNKVEKEREEGVIEKSSGIKPGFWDDTAVSTHSPNNLRKGPHSGFGRLFLTNDEVSPLDGTALAQQFESLALRRLETSHPGPTMTGLTKTEDRRGMKLYRRDREFPRSPEGARTS